MKTLRYILLTFTLLILAAFTVGWVTSYYRIAFADWVGARHEVWAGFIDGKTCVSLINGPIYTPQRRSFRVDSVPLVPVVAKVYREVAPNGFEWRKTEITGVPVFSLYVPCWLPFLLTLLCALMIIWRIHRACNFAKAAKHAFPLDTPAPSSPSSS